MTGAPKAEMGEKQPHPESTMDATAKTVLIVEDNELNMKLFHDLLDAHGYRTIQTRDGLEALDLARKHANVLVPRTFSKIYGLAAERIGWAYGQPGLIATLNRIRAPFNVTSAGQAAAIAALADTDFVAHSRKHNLQWREWMASEIASLSNHDLRAIPSWANFLMVIFEGKTSAETVYKALMDEGYIVRWLPGQGLANGLRITIGSEDENRGVMAALRTILERHS